MTAYLVDLLASQYRIAVLSRGYGRKTKGFVLADSDSTAEQIGDEPLQYFQKFGKKISVAVCEKRVQGTREILRHFPGTNLILLDDAFQHRAIKPAVQILLNDYYRPFYLDHPFPSGNLRERKKGASRADLVVVTKIPNTLSQEEKDKITGQISVFTKPGTPVLFTTIKYGDPVPYLASDVFDRTKKVIGLSGIAQNALFETYLKGHFNTEDHLSYPDHHFFSELDFRKIITCIKDGYQVLTTEKDMVKLKHLATQTNTRTGLFYIPIQTDFGSDSAFFKQWITAKLQ